MKTMKTLLALLIIGSRTPSVVNAGRYDGIVKQLVEFMGGGAAVKRNDSKSFTAVGENGNRFRVYLEGHGSPPHFLLEVPSQSGRHVGAPNTQHHTGAINYG